MRKVILFFVFLISSTQFLSAQHLAISLEEGKKIGLSINHLDSIYKPALDNDSLKAVFQTDESQEFLIKEYTNLLNSFGKFLKQNNFKWEKQTKSWNRVYFNRNGTIDYFIYTFPQSAEPLSLKQSFEFNRLLNLFIKDYKSNLKAAINFSQCSPTIYSSE